MIRQRKTSLLGVLASVALVLSACGSGGSTQKSADDIEWTKQDSANVCSKDNPGVGGDFNLATFSEGGGFDPVSATFSIQAGRQIYGSLMRYDKISDSYESWYAESLEPNADSTEWVMKLKDAEYSDGTALTADAVKRSMSRFADPKTPNSYSSMMALVESIEAVDDTTVKFTLNQPWGTFPWLLTMAPGMIVNPNVLDSLAPAQLAVAPPPEAGLSAFQFEVWNPGRNMVLTKKEDWWGGPVCIDNINVTFNAAGLPNYDAMLAGQLDAFFTLDGPAIVQANDNSEAKLFEVPPAGATVTFNGARAPFDQVDARLAMWQAIDSSVLNDKAWEGLAPASRKVVPDSSAYDISEDSVEFDAAGAKALTGDAGQAWSPVFSLMMNATPNNVNQAVLLSAMAEASGFTMTRDELQLQEYVPKLLVQRDFQAAQSAIVFQDGCIWCSYVSYDSANPANFMASKSPEIDAALDSLRAASGQDEIESALDELQLAWNGSAPAAIMGWIPQALITTDRVEGLLLGSDRLDVYLEKAYLTK